MVLDDDDFGDLPPVVPRDLRPEHRRLAAAVILGVIEGPGRVPQYARAASWLDSPDGRFWARVAGLDVDAAVARLRQFAARSEPER